MPRLPDRPSLSHLKAQAKNLLRAYRRANASAFARFRAALPAARGKDDAVIVALDLRLRDAQSCVAREYGFPSWPDLKAYVEMQHERREGDRAALLSWLSAAYGGGYTRPRPVVAARLLRDGPGPVDHDPYLGCAVGDAAAVRTALAHDAAWVNRAGGPLAMPPLVAVTHSGLIRLPEFADPLLRCARLLLEAGADPDQSWTDPEFPDWPLSALYGAAGKNHHPGMTAVLLEAGADPNDRESLYHSVESADLTCARLLLAAGARPAGSHAVFRVLDFDRLEGLTLLLSHGADPNERVASNAPIHHAILRGRSAAHVTALVDAGADPTSKGVDGLGAYRLALRYGLADVADALRARGVEERLSPEDLFLAACARADTLAAADVLARHPRLVDTLSGEALRLLPDLAQQGRGDAVRTMVDLGWPIDVRGGDWSASALNHAVFRGDAGLAGFLLEHGASWREEHGHHDNVMGTLSYASRSEPVDGGDWLGCARVLIEHGMPVPPAPYRFSDDVADYFEERGRRDGRGSTPRGGPARP